MFATDSKRRVTQRFDAVFWLGDLNYRINGKRASVEEFVGKDKHAHELLLSHDQLRIEMNSKKVFYGFKEGPLNFHPTYKYDIGTTRYDTSKKQRVPSWTDR